MQKKDDAQKVNNASAENDQPGKVFSREALMEHVWNYEGYVGDVRAVDVAVRRLREKVEDNPAVPQFIVTRRGLGYYFNA